MRAWWWMGILGALLGCAGADERSVPVAPPPVDGGTDAGLPEAGDGGTPDGGEPDAGSVACGPGEELPIPADGALQAVSGGGHLVLFFEDFAARYAVRGHAESFPAQGGHYFFSVDGTRAYSGRAFWGYGGGGDGGVYELDAQTRAQTAIFDDTVPEVSADEAAQLIAGRTETGTLFLYDTEARVKHVVSTEASTVGFPVGRHWAFDARGALQIWRRDTRERVTLGRWTRAEPVAGGLLFVDGQGTLFGWSEQGGAQALGKAEPEPVVLGHRADSERGLALIDADGVAWAWRWDTGQVRRLAGQAAAVALPPGAETVAVASVQGEVELIDVATGARRPVLTTAPELQLAFNPQGTKLAVASREERSWAISLVDVGSGVALSAGDVPPQLPGERLTLGFSPDGRYLLVTPAGAAQSVYAADSGALAYRSDLAVATSGTYSRWFDGDVLLLRRGAHMGPPDRGLYAWDGSLGAEQLLGEGTRLGCSEGETLYFERGLAQGSDAPGAVAAWRPEGTVTELSSRAREVRCEAGGGVVFLDDPAHPSTDGRPGPGTLRWASLEDPEGVTFAPSVRRYVLGSAHLAWQTATATCLGALPRD